MNLYGVFTLILLVFFYVDAKAQTIELAAVKLENQTNQEAGNIAISKFAQWGDNEVYAQYDRDPKTRRHFDVGMGFRYLMTDSKLPTGEDWEYAVALAYQGEFDFFAYTRNSSPVVTTRHNPSIFYSRFRNPRKHNFTSWTLSLEHESNGQSTSDIQGLSDVINSISREYIDDNTVTQSSIFEMAKQTISRSNNFFSLAGNYQFKVLDPQSCDLDISCVNLFVKLRHQLKIDVEDDIWWQVGGSDELKKFVGTKVELDTTFHYAKWDLKQGIKISLQTGQLAGGSPFKNNTIDVRYYIDIPIGRALAKKVSWLDNEAFAIPLVIRYHNGYLEELYRYQERSSYWSVGLHAKY